MDGSVTAVTIDPAPAPAPQSLTTEAGNREATVAWDLPATSANVSGFSVTRQPGGQTFTVPATARSYRDTGLVNGQSYTYSVRTLSPDGSSAAIASPPVVPATVPATPKITSTTPGSGSVTVSWTKPSDQGRAITAFELRSGTTVRLVGPTVLKATLSGLPKGKKLRVGVRARNAIGWGQMGLSPYVTTVADPETVGAQPLSLDDKYLDAHGPRLRTAPMGFVARHRRRRRLQDQAHPRERRRSVVTAESRAPLRALGGHPGRGDLRGGRHRVPCTAEESIDVPKGAKHRLGNNGKEELVIVEVQLGAYTGEDDISRYHDDYGR